MSRASRRQVITERIKFVKQLKKELKQIEMAQRELGYIYLKKPIRDGWFKTLKLRADIARSKKSKVYEEILAAVVVEIWGREKKYADKNWDKYFRGNNCRIQRPGIKRLNKTEFAKLSSSAKKYFVQLKIKWNSYYWIRYSCRLPRYYFQFSYRRAYITRYKVTSPSLESREQEIMETLAQAELYRIYYNYGSRLYHNPYKGKRRKIKMALAQNDYLNTDIYI